MGSGIPVHLDPYRYTVPRQPVSVYSVLPPRTASPNYEQTFNQICSYMPYVQVAAYAPVAAKGNDGDDDDDDDDDDDEMYRHRQCLAIIPLSVTLTLQGVKR